MINKARGEELLELSGKSFKVRYDFNALAILEDSMGMSFEKILQNFDDVPKVKFVRSALFAGLQYDRAYRAWSVEKIGNLLTAENYPVALNTLIACIVATMGKQQKEASSEDDTGFLPEIPTPED